MDKPWKNKLILLLSLIILLLVWALAWMGRDEFQHAHDEEKISANTTMNTPLFGCFSFLPTLLPT